MPPLPRITRGAHEGETALAAHIRRANEFYAWTTATGPARPSSSAP